MSQEEEAVRDYTKAITAAIMYLSSFYPKYLGAESKVILNQLKPEKTVCVKVLFWINYRLIFEKNLVLIVDLFTFAQLIKISCKGYSSAYYTWNAEGLVIPSQ